MASPVSGLCGEDKTWCELVVKEDSLRLRAHLQRRAAALAGSPSSTGLPRAPRNQTLSQFCKTRQGEGGWAAALADPAAADAMRAVQRRVKELQGASLAAPARSQLAYTVINADEGGPRHPLLRTSTFHPLQVEAPIERVLGPREDRPREPNPKQKRVEQTSMWTSGWGARANMDDLDLNFIHARPSMGVTKAWKPPGHVHHRSS